MAVHAYCRVSSKDQNLDLQINALKEYGYHFIYKEKESAVKERPKLETVLKSVKKGDTLVVYKFDRLARSVSHLTHIMEFLKDRKVNVVSLEDHVDTTTPQGRLLFNVLASFAEFEREINIERVKAGLDAKRKRGEKLGPAHKHLKKLKKNQGMTGSVKEICEELKIPEPTFYRLKREFNLNYNIVDGRKKHTTWFKKNLTE